MNKNLLLITILVLSLPAFAQVKKTYAYKQVSIPGIVPKINTEEGINKQKAERKETYNYWFYISYSKQDKMNITGLWISGKKYSLKSEPVDNLPVIKVNYTAASENDTVIMVPVTRNAVMLVYPKGVTKDSVAVSKYLSSLVKRNELVIAYTWKGKKYYASKKTITALAPEAQQ